MSYRREDPRPEISHPPSGVVEWLGSASGHGACQVDARTWFEARAQAAILMQCEPGAIQIERTS